MFRSLFTALLLSLFGLSAQAGGPTTLTFTKAFGAANIPLNGTTSLTFTLTSGSALLGSDVGRFDFTDTLPAGLQVDTPSALTAISPVGCFIANGGFPAAVPVAVNGGTQISLTNAYMNSSRTCTFSLNVKGIAAGAQNNSVTAVPSAGLPANNVFEVGSSLTATASLFVGVLPSAANVPTLSQWGLLASMALLALTALWAFTRRLK
jgi:IPTL-CTERM motif